MGKNDLPKVPDGAGRSWHEVIERPNDLARKVPKTGGVNPENAFKEAEAIVKKMAAEYVDKLAQDIDQMKLFANAYRKDPSAKNLDRLFRLIHNMRGQGATFGFPLITEVGRNFCRYVRERPDDKPVRPDLVDQHVKTLQVVYDQSIKGTGDDMAQQVVKALTEVVEKEVGPGV